MMNSVERWRFRCTSRDRLLQTHRLPSDRLGSGSSTNVATENGFRVPVVLAVVKFVAIGSGCPSRLLAASKLVGAS